MANLLQNVLTLQTEYQIPMRMDFTTRGLITYYKSFQRDCDSIERNRLLVQVIRDLEERDLAKTNLSVD